MNNGNTKQTAEVAVEVLEALGTAAVVVSEVNQMVEATTVAETFGLQKDRPLVELELLNLVDWARKSKSSKTVEGAINVGGRAAKVWVQATAAPIGSGSVILTLEDRTEARRLDETRRDFVANISHELKTPIGALLILSEAVLGASDDPEAITRFAGRMQIEAKRLSELVQEIIDLSRLQDDDPLKNGKIFNLNDAMKQDLELFPFMKQNPRKTIVVPILEKRLAEKVEQERLDQE